MTRRHVIALFVLMALAAGAWFWLGRADLAPVPGRIETPPAAAEQALAHAPASSETRRASLPAMPPSDRGFAQSFPDLKARADAGDPKAACRLASGLLRCLHAPESMGAMNLAALEREAEAEGNLAGANYFAEEQAWHIELESECRDIPAELRTQGLKYLRQAALAGDPAAMLAYGSGHHFNPSGRGIAVGPAFDTWQREAHGMLQRALQAGHPAAAFVLSSAYLDDMGIPSAFVPNDAYLGAVHHILVARLFGTRELPGWLAKLDAGEQERARSEAARIHAQVFNGKQYDRKHFFLYPPSLRPRDGAPASCETPD